MMVFVENAVELNVLIAQKLSGVITIVSAVQGFRITGFLSFRTSKTNGACLTMVKVIVLSVGDGQLSVR